MNKVEMLAETREVLRSGSDVLLAFGEWEVREMTLTWEKVDALWEIVKQYRSIFSDLTRDDKANFKRLLLSVDTFWLEGYRNGQLAVLIYLTGLEHSVDATAHLLDLDRDARSKSELCRRVAAYIFDNFPVNRISVPTPTAFYATVRMLEDAGFVREGTKRGTYLHKGRWHDLELFGILRREVTK